MKRYRNKSAKHRALESYYYRSQLSKEDLARLRNHDLGHEGELKLDVDMNVLPEEYLIVNDLMLPYGDTHFQLDKLVAHGDTLHHYEVKNYIGHYKKVGASVTTASGQKILNPDTQVGKANTMLHNTMRRLGYQFKIVSHQVFINPEFYMENGHGTESILFAHQLPGHIRKLLQNPCNPSKRMRQFLSKLMELDDVDYRPPNMPTGYDAKPGIICEACKSFENVGNRQTWVCGSCGYREPMLEAIARTAAEFHLLDPKQEICVRTVSEWCAGTCNRQQIRRALQKHFVQHGKNKGATYSKRKGKSG